MGLLSFPHPSHVHYLQILDRQSKLTIALKTNSKLANMLVAVGFKKFGTSLMTTKLKRIYITLEHGLFKSMGVKADLQLTVDSLNDETIKKLIEHTESLTAIYALLETSLQESAKADSQALIAIIKECQSVNLEIMDVLYNIVRLLKRYSKITLIETSPLAFDSSRRSVNSLKHIMEAHSIT